MLTIHVHPLQKEEDFIQNLNFLLKTLGENFCKALIEKNHKNRLGSNKRITKIRDDLPARAKNPSTGFS